MKVLAVIASPLGKGNTYNIVKDVETRLRRMGTDIEFEYLILKEIDLKTCIGCFQCLAQGESRCPLKDDRSAVEAKMAACDGIIFASPVYVYNMSWMAKNFVDRFAYICHRPRFHGKKAMVVATTGAVGLGFTLFCLAFPLISWGFKIVSRLGVAYPPEPVAREKSLKLSRKNDKTLERAVRRFYRGLTSEKAVNPNLINVVQFMLQKKAFTGAEKDSADHHYWKQKGWLEPKANYYYEAKVGIIKRWLGRFLARVMPL